MNPTDATAAVFGSLFTLLLCAGLYIWVALALSAVFRKSGVEPFKAWVPVLNLVVLLQLAGLSPWFVILAFVPVANIAFVVVFAIALYRVNVAFGLGIGMTVLGILLFPVWASVVGWGSARWVGRETDAASRGPAAPGVRRTGEAAPVLPPLASFAAPAPSPAGPAHFGEGGFAAPEPFRPSDRAAGASHRGVDPAPEPTSAPAAFAPTSSFAPPPAHVPPAPAAEPVAPVTPPASATPPPSATPPVPQTRADAHRPVGAAASADPLAPVVPNAGGWTSPPLPGRPAPAGHVGAGDEPVAWQGFALDSADLSAEVTGAVSGAPAPVSAIPAPQPAASFPARRDDADPSEYETRARPDVLAAPDAATTSDGITRPPVTRVPAAGPVEEREPWAPARSPLSDADAFPEASGPVSAIAGAPDAGAPRSARSSVSAFHAKPEIPDEDDDVFDQTIIARRKRTDWMLIPPTGEPVALLADVVILGRRPAADPAYPGAQLVAIQDGTVSKTHARLRLRNDRWYVTDLDSTNGVLFATVMGTEVEVPPGEEVEAGDRFLLGDAEVRLQRSDG